MADDLAKKGLEVRTKLFGEKAAVAEARQDGQQLGSNRSLRANYLQ